MTLKKWYGGSLRVPHLGTYAAQSFLVSTVGLVRSICLDRLEVMPRIKFMVGGTAAADQDNKIIYINGDYLSGNFTPEVQLTDADTVLSIILGLIVHEIAHFAYSPPLLTAFSEYVREHSTCPFNEEVAMTLGNIVEDVFIEAEVDRDVPSLTWMVDKMNEQLYTDEMEAKVLGQVSGITEAPENWKAVPFIIAPLILAKVRYHIETNDYIKSLFDLVSTATEASTLELRKEIVLDLYNRIMEKVVLPEKEEECEKLQELLKEIAKIIRGLTSDKSEGKEGKEPVGVFDDSFAISTEKMLEGYEKVAVSMMVEGDSDTMLVTEQGIVGGGQAIHIDQRYESLAQVARQNAVVNRPYGLDRNRGSHIRKLHRIATDSKIFAEPVPMHMHKPMEVIILVDCSGSMTRGELLMKAWSAATGAALALTEGRCSVAVYGHTADLEDMISLNIYCAKGFRDSISNLPFSALTVVKDMTAYENRDGSAIRYMGGKFTSAKNKKLLIVFSDGQPAANEYGGMDAIRHSEQQVGLLRSRGIDVLSISLTTWADIANNQIYGRGNNIFNEDPNIIEKIVESIIL